MMTGFRYDPEECGHEFAEVEYVDVTPTEKVPLVKYCPDCGMRQKREVAND